MSKPLRVLLVEDSEDDAELLLCELERHGYSPIHQRVDTAKAMRAALERQVWDIAIADYSMPQFSAIAALKLLQDKQLDLPFIIVSGSIGEDIAVEAMKAGAHDYLIKGKLARLVPAVEREIREAQLRAERKQALEQLRYLAFYDELTGLPNRAMLLDRLRQYVERKSPFTLLFLDLDRYQIVKYSLGHLLADRLLVGTARWLETFLKPGDTVARVGADEFAILLTSIASANEAHQLAAQIHHGLKAPFNLDGTVVFSTTSIGIVLSSVGYSQPEEFLQAADTAMHTAKLQGRGATAVFDATMQELAVERLQLETDLQRAIKYQQLRLHYQPIIDLKTEKITGVEALVRWHHPTRGTISPDRFIPLAENTGLIIPLGEWAIAEACRHLKSWQRQFPHLRSLSVSVNLSGIQLSNPDLLPQILESLRSHQLKGENLKLEITESVLMENATEVTLLLEQLKQQHIQLCIDDFGTGYSSLSYLHRLPIDTLKIDRSFINRMETDSKNADIVKSIVALAHNLGLNVVAEGVETAEQLARLQVLGCECGQGYLFARPLTAEAVAELLAKPELKFLSHNSAIAPLAQCH